MIKTKQFPAFLLALVIVFSMLPRLTANAKIISGYIYYDGCKWEINTKTRVLTISGSGEIRGFATSSDAQEDGADDPWAPYLEYFDTVVIKSGVGQIGAYAFCIKGTECPDPIAGLVLPSGMTAFSSNAFACRITDLYYEGSTEDWNRVFVREYDYDFRLTRFHHDVQDYTAHNEVESHTEPTCTQGGSTAYTCSCGHHWTVELPAYGHLFKNGFCTVCGAKDPNYVVSPSAFLDVPDTAYYAAAVQWAVANGVTNGTSETSFSPNSKCTRAQVVTFLWRAKGQPEPAGSEPGIAPQNPFTDVKDGAYYYKAVLWAVENEITAGVGNGKFNPGGDCTRAQVVTFLWRANGKPEPAGSEPGTDPQNPFTDVDQSAFYSKAVLWAVENEITSGTSATKFSPGKSCTRAQVVTFLYRADQP